MLPVNEVVGQYWRMLETQSSLGRKTLQDIPIELRRLCPLKWCTDWQYREGMRLLVGYYSYDNERASEVLQRIDFNVIRELQEKGYEGAKQAFKDACLDYYEWQVSYRGI
ncbi:hypothetical protein [Escherichia phage vB_EcoP_PAS7]|uniref:Uncharacterized protein n=1 Tax=Escherichia phage vB_EcoP_PAS7 TaxID=3053875 RepID=A0AA51Z014_9CAUD|nr:hypothetical protein [Escherichia phage vB_EcoP_PAS7]